MTYKDSTQVVRKRQSNQHTKKVDSKAILKLIAVKVTLSGALRIWNIKATNTSIANQTNN